MISTVAFKGWRGVLYPVKYRVRNSANTVPLAEPTFEVKPSEETPEIEEGDPYLAPAR